MMKTCNLTKVVLALVVLGLTFTGCTENDTTDPVPQEQDVSEVMQAAEMDEVSASMEDFIIETYENQEASEARGMSVSTAKMPDCVTLTLVAQQNFRELTVDFGIDGCMIRGHRYRGQIVINWERDPQAQQVTLGYVLNDFYFDAKQVIGSNSILRELSNINGNPQFTHTVDITVIWPNGAEASREGQIIREWIEGFGSGEFTDNVFEVTGYWNATFRNGNSHAYEVILPLRREVTCYHFVGGSVDVERTYFGGLLDFGDGACDNLATFTFNDGNTIDIILR
ncbi:hypothetical protein [Hanstruepera ponticola]|uniref:hypothetical protein n=1 Tax=Hanstruepera ponticola TaxID=2042995 RepID=UPI001E4B101E|nr:hypothetical protein [Hanstruepera ponticola]